MTTSWIDRRMNGVVSKATTAFRPGGKNRSSSATAPYRVGGVERIGAGGQAHGEARDGLPL